MYQLLRRVLPTLAVLALVFQSGADAQLRRIVAKNVSASSSGSSLEIEFADESALSVRLQGGTVYVDGATVGSYEPGGALEIGWRELLGDAMGLENGALAERLVGWDAPAGGATEAVAQALDEAFERAIREPDGAGARVAERGAADDEVRVVRALLRSVDRLGALEGALAGLDSDFRIHVGEDVHIDQGSVVEGPVVMIDGTLRVDGEVRGDVVVVGGALDVRESGVIRGEVRVADARILRNDGDVRGGIVDVLEDERELEANLRNRLREEIRAEVRRDLRNEIRNVTRMEGDGFSIMAPFRPIIRGVGGVLEKLVLIFVLGLLGAGFFAFAGENVDAIADTARRSPGRAAMVGFAGSFLLIPVWILGAVALVVSIIGIPVAIAWLPLFPLAAVLAAILGYIAVARNTGEWLADSDFPWTGWIRKSNPVFTLFGGLVGLCLAFIASHVLSMAPFLGVFSGLLFVAGVIVTCVAVQIGFGAVILTRGGRRREHHGAYDADAAWEAAMSVEVDDELVDPVGSSPVDDERGEV